LTEATDRLTEAEEVVISLQNQLKDKDDTEYKALKEANKAMQDTIKLKKELIIGKKLEKQGYGRLYQITPQQKLFEAMNYLNSKLIAPTTSDLNLVDQLEFLTAESIQKVNTFFSKNWIEYRNKVQANPIKTFKDYLPIGVEK
jgi:hypothetical protein